MPDPSHGASNTKKGGGISPAPCDHAGVRPAITLRKDYHSNRAPTRTCRGVWNEVKRPPPTLIGWPKFVFGTWKEIGRAHV